MQLRESSLKGQKVRCPHNRAHPIHSHGSYSRRCHPRGEEFIAITRWLCVVCGRTISVLPDWLFPYRSIHVDVFEAWLCAQYRGRAPPLVCEVEKECLRRAHKRFEERIPSLTSRLGQMVEPINPSALELWNSLQALNPLREILRMLSEQFKISLLADYLCLQPWPLHD